LPYNRDRGGARCPSCHDPLYEPPGRFARAAREGETACALHPGNESIGPCGRCGNYLCEVCRTRWREQVLCPTCVERALGSNEVSPEQTRSEFRRAIISVISGGGAWVVGVVAIIFCAVLASSADNPGAFVLITLFLLGGLLLAAAAAVFGAGFALAVLRARGSHMILATFGLLLSGLYLGFLVGLFSFSVWQL
jgi:hypothetical protein